MMPTATVRAAALAAGLFIAAAAAAQERPSEEDIFGKPAEAPQPAKKQQAPEPQPQGAPPAAQEGPPVLRPNENPLAIGGVAYLRATSTVRERMTPSEWLFLSPNLLDLYADVRPNDRVRAYALGRLLYQPTQGAGTFQAPRLGDVSGGGTTPFGGFGAAATTTALLDQLWVNFDVDRTVFVTAGKQHVKWGVGHFWNPTDYLHPVRRDPLAVYDTRTGVTMVKAHLPWEARGWNLYGVGLLEDAAGQGGIGTVGRVGGGARAEVVLGTAEIGADALVQRNNRPRFGVDASAGVGEVDLYAEAALRAGADFARFVPNPNPASSQEYDEWQPVRSTGFTPQVTLGGTWSWKYSDEDSLNVGAEYFFNDAGYSDAHVYGSLLVAQLFPQYYPDPAAPAGFPAQHLPAGGYFNPFYLGRHYAGAFLNLPKPGSWNDWDFTLSVLANLSDRTAIARLDCGVVVNTFLRVEAFVAGHAGPSGGEFRLAVPPSEIPIPQTTPPQTVSIPRVRAPLVDAGVALRVNL